MSGAWIRTEGEITRADFGHAWRDQDGDGYATVRLGGATLTFEDPQRARAAAACIRAAEALEAMCRRCGQPPAEGNDLCRACEEAEAAAALAVLRKAAAEAEGSRQ